MDEGARMTWMRQPHYYSGLYSYTYSVGLTVATAAMPKVANGDTAARDRWLAALSAGPTRTAQDLALMAGVDLGTAEPLHQAAAFVGGLVDELEGSFA
jgi:oligoendopeptidase F